MRLLDQIVINHQSTDHFIKLYVGDLSAIPPSEAVDLLIVSAFPDDYTPTRKSLIGALARRGISLQALAMDKAVDLREFSTCWLSREISSAKAGCRRILCFEPLTRGPAHEVAGDIFRSIIPFTTDTPPIRQIAMPLVAAGDQGNAKPLMLTAIVEAAAHWFSVGLSLECIKIVIHDDADEISLRAVFAGLKSKLAASNVVDKPAWRYDTFISYSHEDNAEVDVLVEAIKASKPSARLFHDRTEIPLGAAWLQRLTEAIDQCRKVLTVLSPPYLESKFCQTEYNIAYLRHLESGGVLQPIYLHTAPLPTHMKLVQFIDARAGEKEKLRAAGSLIAQDL